MPPLVFSISIHAPRAGRDGVAQANSAFNAISIHAPRAGRDLVAAATLKIIKISIPAPRAGRDCATDAYARPTKYFNPRAPCGARHVLVISKLCKYIFQSTRPVRGATCAPALRSEFLHISIHAPRAGRDEPVLIISTEKYYFNPRAPCGARQQKYTKLLYTLLRQKAILRQFHAKRRLLKRFSTYKYRNTFLICSANRMGKICTLPLRTTRSLDLPEGMSACSQSARFCFRTFFPSSKTADYPALDP